MSPVTVKSDDSLRTPKSSKLPPELPLTLFLGPNLISLESRPSIQAIVCTPSCFWELWGFFSKKVELSGFRWKVSTGLELSQSPA